MRRRSRFEHSEAENSSYHANKTQIQVGQINLQPGQSSVEGHPRKSIKSQISARADRKYLKSDFKPSIKEQKLHNMAHSGGFTKRKQFGSKNTRI
jgi:hypothetical protein